MANFNQEYIMGIEIITAGLSAYDYLALLVGAIIVSLSAGALIAAMGLHEDADE